MFSFPTPTPISCPHAAIPGSKSSRGRPSVRGSPYLCSQPLCLLVLLPISSPNLILLTLFLKTLYWRTLLLSIFFKDWAPCQPFDWCPYHAVIWLHQLPTPGHSFHPFSLLQRYTTLLKVTNTLVYYDFIYLPMTPFAYSKIPKGLPPTNSQGKKLCVCE